MLFAEALAMLRRDGYTDAADIMEEQAMQILMNRQAVQENEALKKQLTVVADDKSYYQEELHKARQDCDTLSALLKATQDELHTVTEERNEAWEAICDHCQDIPCQEQSCYWYRKQYGTANTKEDES